MFTVTLEEALKIYAEPKRRGRQASAAAPLRELGNDAATGKPMVIKDGRFGPYVTDGETNASLRKGDEVESITDERASELLADRRARGRSRRRPPRRRHRPRRRRRRRLQPRRRRPRRPRRRSRDQPRRRRRRGQLGSARGGCFRSTGRPGARRGRVDGCCDGGARRRRRFADDALVAVHRSARVGPVGCRGVLRRGTAVHVRGSPGLRRMSGLHDDDGRTHGDVRRVVPEGLSISVSEMRGIVQTASRRPSTGRWQVVVVEDADRLTEGAANALLKVVEEPPERTVFCCVRRRWTRRTSR